MSFDSKILRSLCAFALLFALSAVAFGDTLRLKDGSIIKGRIVGFAGGRFTVATGDGTRTRQTTYSAEEIESIQFDALQSGNQIGSNTPTANPKNSNSTIITVGQNSRNPNEPVVVPKVITTSAPSITPPVTTPAVVSSTPTTNTTAAAPVKPIELNVKVLADNTSNGWTNSGWVVRKGQRIRILGNGRVSLGGGRFTTASGISSLPDTEKLMKAVPTGALIAVVGDDNNEFIYVGGEREFVAQRDGALFLGVNEGNLNDNTGAFDVRIEIDPNLGN